MKQDTIFALSTGALPSGVAIIRISGSLVCRILNALVGNVPEPRFSKYARIKDRSGNLLDHGLVVFFKGPNSFTGEDCAELQVHGSRAVVSALTLELSSFEDVRLAEAGEFTRRAFENGRLDLTEVEGLSDLIKADTRQQMLLAHSLAEGKLTELYDAWLKRIIHARAMIEAEFDFSDEEDIPGSISDKIWQEMFNLANDISEHTARFKIGEVIRNGFKIAIVGAPNVGKSSLLNYLAERDVAIVSEFSGTTRDVIEVELDLDGYSVTFSDTAGIRDTDDFVEKEGVRRSIIAANRADLVLNIIENNEENQEVISRIQNNNIITAYSKSDLANAQANYMPDSLSFSTKNNEGMNELFGCIGDFLNKNFSGGDFIFPARVRHLKLLNSCQELLLRASNETDMALELRAELLRDAGVFLSKISGRIDVEDLLDVIFGEFCVGK